MVGQVVSDELKKLSTQLPEAQKNYNTTEPTNQGK